MTAGWSLGVGGSAILFLDGYVFMRVFSYARDVSHPVRSDVFPDRD